MDEQSGRSQFHSQADYRVALLETLAELSDGTARARDVVARFEERYGDYITPDHRAPRHANTTVPIWKDMLHHARLDLVRRDLMDSPENGVWRITEQGRRWLAQNPYAEQIDPATLRLPVQPKRRKRTAHTPKRQLSTALAGPPTNRVTFRLNGRIYRLSGEDVLRRVRQALAAGAPAEADDYRTWAVEVDDRRLNVKWILELAVDQPRTSFDTPIARKLLQRLGIEAVAVQPRTAVRKPRPSPKPTSASPDAPDQTARHATLDREVAAIHNFLSGRADRPSDEKLCDWVYFCYTFGLYGEAERLFQVVNPAHVDAWYFARTKRVAQVCAQRARG